MKRIYYIMYTCGRTLYYICALLVCFYSKGQKVMVREPSSSVTM